MPAWSRLPCILGFAAMAGLSFNCQGTSVTWFPSPATTKRGTVLLLDSLPGALTSQHILNPMLFSRTRVKMQKFCHILLVIQRNMSCCAHLRTRSSLLFCRWCVGGCGGQRGIVPGSGASLWPLLAWGCRMPFCSLSLNLWEVFGIGAEEVASGSTSVTPDILPPWRPLCCFSKPRYVDMWGESLRVCIHSKSCEWASLPELTWIHLVCEGSWLQHG